MKTEFIIHEIQDRMNLALDGEVNELEAWSDLYRIRETVDEAMTAIKESALYTLDKYGGKLEDFGYKFERMQTGRYNYSMNPEWVELSQRIKALEKASQEAYKMALNGAILVDRDGCEVITAEYIQNAPSIKITKIK